MPTAKALTKEPNKHGDVMAEIGEKIAEKALDFLLDGGAEIALDLAKELVASLLGEDLVNALFGNSDDTLEVIDRKLDEILDLTKEIYEGIEELKETQFEAGYLHLLELVNQAQDKSIDVVSLVRNDDGGERSRGPIIDDLLKMINPISVSDDGIIDPIRKLWDHAFSQRFPIELTLKKGPAAHGFVGILSSYLLSYGPSIRSYLSTMLQTVGLLSQTLSTFAFAMRDGRDYVELYGSAEQKQRMTAWKANPGLFTGPAFAGELSGLALNEMLQLWPGLAQLFQVIVLRTGEFRTALICANDDRLLENWIGRQPFGTDPVHHNPYECLKPFYADFNASGLDVKNDHHWWLITPEAETDVQDKVALGPLGETLRLAASENHRLGTRELTFMDLDEFKGRRKRKPRTLIRWDIKLKRDANAEHVDLAFVNANLGTALEIDIRRPSSISQQVHARNPLDPKMKNASQLFRLHLVP